MHDIDRVQLEASGLEATPPSEQGEGMELGELGEDAAEGAMESPLNELQEIELASELLEVGSEAELEQFLGSLMSRVGTAAGNIVRSDTGRALGGILKSAVKRALPVIGGGIGQWITPSRGGDLGASAGRWAAQAMGLELEGLSGEDRDFEVAKQLVRLAAAATRRAALGPAGAPVAVAQRAVAGAARQYAPGLFRRLPGRSTLLWPRMGRWVRRGRTIILFGG
jgi:hypothetical protein